MEGSHTRPITEHNVPCIECHLVFNTRISRLLATVPSPQSAPVHLQLCLLWCVYAGSASTVRLMGGTWIVDACMMKHPTDDRDDQCCELMLPGTMGRPHQLTQACHTAGQLRNIEELTSIITLYASRIICPVVLSLLKIFLILRRCA